MPRHREHERIARLLREEERLHPLPRQQRDQAADDDASHGERDPSPYHDPDDVAHARARKQGQNVP